MRIRKWMALAVFVLPAWLVLGCESPEQNAVTLKLLQEGKARGHLTLGSSGVIGLMEKTEIGLGALGTTVTFDGDINFGDGGRTADFDALIAELLGRGELPQAETPGGD